MVASECSKPDCVWCECECECVCVLCGCVCACELSTPSPYCWPCIPLYPHSRPTSSTGWK